MRFKGQLLLPSEPGPGLRVDLEVAGHHLAVQSDGAELGAWPLETVQVRRLEGDTFAMTVAGEDLHFVAEDTISFAYSGVPAIESVSGPWRPKSRLRGFLARFGSGAAELPRATAVQASRAEEASSSMTSVEEMPAGVPQPPAEIGYFGIGEDVTDDEVIDVTALAFDPDLEAVDHPSTPEPEERHEPIAETDRPETSESEEPEDAPSCPGLTSEGLPCRSPILGPSGYCYNHDPERAAEDGYRKALEARARMKRKGTARLTKVYSRLEKAMRQVERGELEPDIAVAMAQIARTMCAILDLDTEESEDEGGSDLSPRF